jgi:glycosyltransferase involved in cell wall biosynthesis
MRLAVEVTTCTATRSGIGYYTEHLVDALLDTCAPGDEVLLIANREPAPPLARRWANHLHVQGAGIRALWMQRDAPGLLSSLGADLAVFPNYIVPLASPCPTVVVVHDLALVRMPELFTLRKRVAMRALMRQSIAAATRIATVSEASRQDIARWLEVDPARIALLPGAAHPSCAPASPAEVAAVSERYHLRRPYVLTVGTLEPRKNLLTLLEAFDALGERGRDLELVVVGGRGWHDRQMLRALETRAPQGRVRWLGYVPERDLGALYTGARLFVYPSRFEGMGLPVVEAMACGAPVIASDVAALREVGADAATFVPPGDSPALAAAIAGVLARPDEPAARARRIARAADFSWPRTAQATWKLAHETASTRIRTRAVPAAPHGAAAVLGAPPRGLAPREWALLASVTYADRFEAPLPVDEALRSCIGATWTELELHRAVAVEGAPLAPHLTLAPNGLLVLAGRDDLVARRQQGAVQTEALLERNRRVLTAVATLPFIRMVGFSGGTAHRNPGVKPDIDLFIVAAKGRAYTVYALLFLATKVTGTRHIVCPNYLIDETELTIAYHHDLFTAHQLVSVRPASGGSTYQAFCESNADWVRSFFPGFQPRDSEVSLGRPGLQRAGELFLGPVAALIERLARWGLRTQLRRRAARAPQGDVVLADGILKLHLSDYRRRVLAHFGEQLEALRSRLDGVAKTDASSGSRAVRP